MSNEIYEKLEICRKSILQKTNFKPEVAVIPVLANTHQKSR